MGMVVNNIKWRSCNICKYYNACGGSGNNPKWKPCNGWEKKSKIKEIKVLKSEELLNTGLSGIERPVVWYKH